MFKKFALAILATVVQSQMDIMQVAALFEEANSPTEAKEIFMKLDQAT